MKVFLQILKEFSFPFMLAIIWTLFNLFDKIKINWSFKEFINIFGPSFFFASWIFSQWFRVRKQQTVETGLMGIETSIKRTLNELDNKTTDLVGHITGGDSACYFLCNIDNNNTLHLTAVVHIGKHTLYEAIATIVNLNVIKQRTEQTKELFMKNKFNFPDTTIDIGNIAPNYAKMIDAKISSNTSLESVNKIYDLNVFFSARNGNFKQLIRYKKINNKWLCATKVEKEISGNTKTFYEKIDDNFPLNLSGEVEW